MSDAATPETPVRPTTAIDEIAENWVTTLADLVPDVAIWIGIPGRTGEFADLSPAGHEQRIGEVKKVIAALEAADPGRRGRPGHADRPARRAATPGGELRRAAARARPERHRLAGAGDPRDLRPDAHRRPSTTGRSSPNDSATCPAPSTATSRRCAQGIADGVVPAKRQAREVAVQARTPRASRRLLRRVRRRREARGRRSCPESLRADLAKGAEVSAAAYARARRLPRDRSCCPAAQRPGRRRPRALRPALPPLPRRRDRPRRDLRVGHRRAPAHDRRADADRRRDQARRECRRGRRVPRRRSVPPSQRHRRAAALDAVAERPRRRRALAHPLRHPRADPQARVHDRADPGGRHLLHEPERRLLAPRTDVVERPRGRHRVRHLARDDDGLPRGRSRTSPPDRPGRLQPRAS